ncbi:hypothetical protein C5167_027902 [Papaver somniferum]|nr:hypothetical protein C5167_027902 [Papaver somniferum]
MIDILYASRIIDPVVDLTFASTLLKACTAGDNAEIPFDQTRKSFDNSYFNGLRRSSGVLSSDQTLYSSPRTRGLVNAYVMNTARFFFDFQQAMVKMGLIDVKQGNQGEIRQNCRVMN